MAPFLPIRSFNRRNSNRIGTKNVAWDATTYVDLGSGVERRDLNHHVAIGSVFPVGPITGTVSSTTVVSGGLVTAGAGLTVNVSAGEIRNRDTGAYVVGAAATNATVTANASGNPRVDLVSWSSVGAVVVTAGTPAASGAMAPATPAGNTPLATVAVANGASAPGTITDVRPRG